MMDFLLSLFLSDIILLTGQPVDIERELQLQLEEPVTAIHRDAGVEVDVTQTIDGAVVESLDIEGIRAAVAARYPAGTVRARLHHAGGVVHLEHNGGALIGDEVRISLRGDVPTDTEFHSITLQTKVSIPGARVYWNNYGGK